MHIARTGIPIRITAVFKKSVDPCFIKAPHLFNILLIYHEIYCLTINFIYLRDLLLNKLMMEIFL